MAAHAPTPSSHTEAELGNRPGTIGFVLSLIGTLCGLVPFGVGIVLGFPLGIIGLIYSARGWRDAEAEPARPIGLSIIGAFLGIAAIAVSIVWVVLLWGYA